MSYSNKCTRNVTKNKYIAIYTVTVSASNYTVIYILGHTAQL